MTDRAEDEQVREVIRDAITFQVSAEDNGNGTSYVDGIEDAVNDVLADLSAAGYEIVKRPIGPDTTTKETPR